MGWGDLHVEYECGDCEKDQTLLYVWSGEFVEGNEAMSKIEITAHKEITRECDPDQKSIDVVVNALVAKGYTITVVGDKDVEGLCEHCSLPVFEEDRPQPYNDVDLCGVCLKEEN